MSTILLFVAGVVVALVAIAALGLNLLPRPKRFGSFDVADLSRQDPLT